MHVTLSPLQSIKPMIKTIIVTDILEVYKVFSVITTKTRLNRPVELMYANITQG